MGRYPKLFANLFSPRKMTTIYTLQKKNEWMSPKEQPFQKENHCFSGANCQFQGGYYLFPLSS